jgi:hypothetical protein
MIEINQHLDGHYDMKRYQRQDWMIISGLGLSKGEVN